MEQGTRRVGSRSDISKEASSTGQDGAPRRHDEDRALIKKAIAGDHDSFEALVRKYQGRVFTMAYRMLGNRADAEDMAQEIFLKAYRGLPQFEGRSTFSTWLYSIATHHCLNQLASRRRWFRSCAVNEPSVPGGNPGFGVDRVADPSPGADRALEQADLQRLVQQQLLALSPEQRAILVLRDIQGLSYEEIGQLLRLEPGTVRSRLHRARMELKERLTPYR